ncbi:hypothetical protein [Noviherbaspirillum sp. ST9]|uniref:hypothetical protein n=1 Tax=Noviherbaspirillum sp. ST9 TaxID=3401606 RepID=UPI003B588670
MAQEEGNKNITLDDLLELVESAARTIERLQAVNASLTQQVRDAETAAQRAVSDAEDKARQLEAMEKADAALREDAEWCRWFKERYGASTFFSHIEREYQQTHGTVDPVPRVPQSGIAPDAS